MNALRIRLRTAAGALALALVGLVAWVAAPAQPAAASTTPSCGAGVDQFGVIIGSCTNGDPAIRFRVQGWCQTDVPVAGDTFYLVTSPWTPTTQTAITSCYLGGWPTTVFTEIE